MNNKEELVKVETYKGIELFYDKEGGRIYFKFEDQDMETKYIFEAKRIIDEPVWEECDVEGFWLDSCFDSYIGLARAKKRDRKSGKYCWLLKGQYDLEYKHQDSWREQMVYEKTPQREVAYNYWEVQLDIANREQRKANDLADRIKEE